MINLLPPEAKRVVKKEYMLRVYTIWMFLLASVILIVSVLQIPSFVLAKGQIKALAIENHDALKMKDTFQGAVTTISDTNELIKHYLTDLPVHFFQL